MGVAVSPSSTPDTPSPGECRSCFIKSVSGDPIPHHISTSYVEGENLMMRMSMRRFTRLTNAFWKKLANHAYPVALHLVHHNFCRIHKTPRMSAVDEGRGERHAARRRVDRWSDRRSDTKAGAAEAVPEAVLQKVQTETLPARQRC